MKRRARPPAAPRTGAVPLDDVRKAAAQAEAILALTDRPDAELAALGLDRRDVDAVRRASGQLQQIVMPSARSMVLASLGGGLKKELVLQGYHAALATLHALAPKLVYLAAWKLDDDKAPGSTRLLIELLRGLGLLQPAQAVDTTRRMEQVDFERLKERALKDPAALKAEILEGAR